jgi:integrase
MRGSVVKRGNRWEARWRGELNPTTGRRRNMSRSFATKREASEHLAATVAAVNNGSYVTPHRQTFGEYLIEWHEGRRAQLRPSTWATYDRYLRVHVLPHLGHVRLADLDGGHLERLYSDLLSHGRRPSREGRPAAVAERAASLKSGGATWAAVAERLTEEHPEHGPYTRHSAAALVRRHVEEHELAPKGDGLSPRTVAQVHTIIKRALKDAVRRRRLARNPADTVDPPRRSVRPELPVWDAETVAEYLDRSQADEDRLHALWHFLAATGVRRGEALGLRWSDVDLSAAMATVVQTVVTVDHVPVVSEPKTAAGRRPVHLDRDTLDALRQHRKQQNEERLLIGSGWHAEGLVFCSVDGRALHPDRVSREFDRRVKRWGLPRIPLHGLRHTWATLAMRAGVHPRVVQERLGHSTIAVTLGTYSHVAPVMHEDAAELVAGMFRR